MADTYRLKYPELSATFFRGSIIGQIRSVHKTRFDRPGKVEDFKRAIEAGDVTLVPEVPRAEVAKLARLGITMPGPAASSDGTPDEASGSTGGQSRTAPNDPAA